MDGRLNFHSVFTWHCRVGQFNIPVILTFWVVGASMASKNWREFENIFTGTKSKAHL